MLSTLAAIVSDLNSLTASDFDYENPHARGWERLYDLCDDLHDINMPEESIPTMIEVLERLGDCDLGSPGSLVHTLEHWTGHYETLLSDSVRRKPVCLSVWMVNRILNMSPPDQPMWLELLHRAATHPLASESAKAGALRFLEFQGMRLGN